jgi:hypothetical protein
MGHPFEVDAMTYRPMRILCCLLPLVSCTPLGLWMYQDPQVTVDRVRLDAEAEGGQPVVVGLALHNFNDYPVSATRLEFRLSLDELPIGRLDQASSVAVPVGVATVVLPIEPDRRTSPGRLRAFHSGVHRFQIEGRATFATPIGKRKVRFVQEGELAFGPPLSPASAPADPGASP